MAHDGAALSIVDVMKAGAGAVQGWVMERRHTPVSDYLFDLLRPRFSSLVPDEARYTETFGRWEYLYSLHRAHIDGGIPLGQFAWCETGRGDSVIRPISEEASRMGIEWPPLKAGLFGGTVEAFNKAQARVLERVRQVGWY